MLQSKNVAADVGSGGDWLYRQGELVLGPVSGKQLVEKLYTGEIDGRTEISPLGQSTFRRVAEVDALKVHLAKAEAKKRVEAAEREDRDRNRRRRNMRIALVITVALVAAAGAAVAARYLAIYNPLKRGDELAFADITMDAPTIEIGTRRADEELLEYPVGGTTTPATPRKPERTPEKGAEKPERTPEKPEKSRPAVAERTPGTEKPPKQKMSSAADDPDGLQMGEVDQEAINAVVAAKRQTLFVCFKEEAQRNEKFSGKIPLEFTIGGDGRVNKLWVDRPEYSKGPLADCLLKELQKWPFKANQTGASVKLAFNIGNKG